VIGLVFRAVGQFFTSVSDRGNVMGCYFRSLVYGFWVSLSLSLLGIILFDLADFLFCI